MDCARNIITANFSGGKTHATTARVYQWSRGIELCITGADNLPQTFKAHFSVQKRGGVATTIVGIDERVDVPNVLFTIGKDIHVWLGASETEDDAEILYTVDIPVSPAPMPEYYDAEDTGVFDAVVEQVADYAATATAAANSAGASATAAAGSASAAAASASSAAGSAAAAEQARADAVTAKGQAETAAQTATEKALQTAQNASQAALDAGRAESAAERAESAETGAGAAKTAAEAAAQNAAASAATANEKATLAGQSATAAAGSASAAAQSAASIEGDVQIASQKASEAQTAAGQAVTAKDAAVTAQQGAEAAATNAGQSASTATAKAAEAATSASNAAQSKTDAEAAAARAEQAAATLMVDTALSDTSTNPVQNKVITGELTDVKTALLHYYSVSSYTFVFGGIYNGSENADTNRIRTPDFIRVFAGMRIVTDASYPNLIIAPYNTNKQYLRNESWTNDYTVQSDTVYVKIVLRKAQNATIDASEFDGLKETVRVLYDFVPYVNWLQGQLDGISAVTDQLDSDITDVENGLSSYKNDIAEEIGCSPIIYNTSGYYYNLAGSFVIMSGGVPQTSGTNASYKSGYVACSPGDVFTVNLTGGVSARAYGFIKSNGDIISGYVAGESKTFTNEILTAPTDAAFLIVQTTGGKTSFKGDIVRNRLDSLEEETKEITNIQECVAIAVVSQFESGGIYPNTGTAYTNSKYIRTKTYIDSSKYKKIRFNIGTGYKVGARFYKYPNTTPGSFQGSVADLTGNAEAEIKTNYNYFRFVISRTDNQDISTSEASNVLCKLCSELLDRVDAIESIVDLVDPEEIDANLVKNASFKFAFFSDIHGGSVNAQHIVGFAEENNLDCIINGGDTVLNYLNDPNNSFDWYATLLSGSSVDILSAVGNHDVWDEAYWTKAASTDIYNAIVAPIISNFSNIQQPTGAAESGLCYFYKDYGAVRVIVLNAMSGSSSVSFWDDTEKTWLNSVLSDAITNSKHVIICNHPPFATSIAVRDKKSNWNSYIDYTTMSNFDGIVTNTEVLGCINTFISGGGKFICMLTGHVHVDSILTATGYNGQFMVNIASAKYTNHPDGLYYSNPESPYYDCFDYCVVDTTNGILKLKRIGWNMDASMKERRTLSYNYFTHQLLHE